MKTFDYLAHLPGDPQEQMWVRERLETLSVREEHILTAAVSRLPPQDVETAANYLLSLNDYKVCFPAASFMQLGQFYAAHGAKLPGSALPYVDMEQLGRIYAASHPGAFIGDCYIVFSSRPDAVRRETGSLQFQDNDWSVKLKLASSAVPEGVWLRLPDHDGSTAEHSSEVRLALHKLQAASLEDCTVLEARCVLPEAVDLMAQYDSVTELVKDCGHLSFILDGHSQDEDHWMEKLSAALEYEDCRTLKFALDISQNLHCYDWVPYEDLAISAEGLLLDAGVPAKVINSGCIDLCAYKADLLETSGYMQASGETGYLLRNTQQFLYEYSAPEQGGITMQ